MAAPSENGTATSIARPGDAGRAGHQREDAVLWILGVARRPVGGEEELAEVHLLENEADSFLGDEEEDAEYEEDGRDAADEDDDGNQLVDVPVEVTAVEILGRAGVSGAGAQRLRRGAISVGLLATQDCHQIADLQGYLPTEEPQIRLPATGLADFPVERHGVEGNLLDVGLHRALQADDDLESGEFLVMCRDRLRPVVAEVDSQILQQGNRLRIGDAGRPAATVIFANFREILARNRLGDRAEQAVVLVYKEDAEELWPLGWPVTANTVSSQMFFA
jgi:hypothetical protein